MIANIQKWGNSLALRIPKVLAEEVHVQDGASVDMTIEDGRLVIAPKSNITESLASLLERVTPENLHGEVDFGEPVGREVW